MSATAKIARISFGTIPRSNPVAVKKKTMINYIHARVYSLDTVGMPAPMHIMDPPAVILVITFVMTDSQHAYSTTVTCSEKPVKAGGKH